jgi:phosphoribosylanthranilate isomerase
MSLKTKVFIGNITHLSDARYAAGMGVDWLGFPAQAVNPVLFREITDWLSGPEFVLEAQVLETPEHVQEYGTSSAVIGCNQLAWIDALHNRIMVSASAEDWNHYREALISRSQRISFLILHGYEVEKIQRVMKEASQAFSLLIDIQSVKAPLDEILQWPVSGIYLSGSAEMKPGLKNYDSLSDVLEALEDSY